MNVIIKMEKRPSPMCVVCAIRSWVETGRSDRLVAAIPSSKQENNESHPCFGCPEHRAGEALAEPEPVGSDKSPGESANPAANRIMNKQEKEWTQHIPVVPIETGSWPSVSKRGTRLPFYAKRGKTVGEVCNVQRYINAETAERRLGFSLSERPATKADAKQSRHTPESRNRARARFEAAERRAAKKGK